MNSNVKPNGFFSNIKDDAIAGIIVFLIALPLCLGIAQASGAPLFSGIVSGIIGGIVVGTLSGSQLSVVGPAAGLTAIILVALEALPWDVFLCAVIVAGAIQLILGFAKAGSIASYFPNSVIEGMLAGIGLTIIIKQIPEAIGYDGEGHERMASAEDGFTLDYVTSAFNHIETGAVIISLTGIALLLLWTTRPFQKLKLLPSGLVVVIVGVLLNELFHMQGSALYLGTIHLVNLPVAESFKGFVDQFTLPDFSGFSNMKVWETGLIIAIVASIETLLCIEATDKLDPQKRFTPTNRELKAQGIGNMLSGFVGGLPMTSVIVRSSANIHAGAKTKTSAIVHGILLLVCVATIPFILNLIPKASLAAILIFVGYKLCNPKSFIRTYQEGGWTQFIPLVVTTIAVVSLDLLKGVGIGLIISIIFILRRNMQVPFFFRKSKYDKGDLIEINLAQEVSFLNKAGIKEALQRLPENSNVVIDASNTEYIDYDVLELFHEFHEHQANDKNIKMSLVGFKESYKIPLNAVSTKQEVLDQMQVTRKSDNTPSSSEGNYKTFLKEHDNNSN